MALVTPGLMHWPGITKGDVGFGLATALRTLDAAGEYDGYVIPARQDMTISHVGLYLTAAGSPTLDVRVETVSTTDGFPTGALWATNTNIVTGALTTGFTLHALTAPATINRGQIFAVRINLVSGTSVVTRVCGQHFGTGNSSLPYEVYSIGTPTRGGIASWHPWALGNSTTTFYQVGNFLPMAAGTLFSFNNASAAKKGARFRVPFKCRCAGIRVLQAVTNGNFNALIMDDAGGELGSSSTLNVTVQMSTNTGSLMCLFDNPVTLTPGVWYRAALEPTTTTNVRLDYATLPNANYRMAWPGGTDFYLAEFATSSWTDSTDKVPSIDLLLDQIGDGCNPPVYATVL